MTDAKHGQIYVTGPVLAVTNGQPATAMPTKPARRVSLEVHEHIGKRRVESRPARRLLGRVAHLSLCRSLVEECSVVLENLNQMAHAVEDNWCAAWASLGGVHEMPQTVVDDTPNYLRVYTSGAPEMLLNIVMRYTVQGPTSVADIEEVIAPYREHRLPFQWWLTRSAEPVGLRERLRQLGMQTLGGATSMTLELAHWEPRYRPVPSGLALGELSSAEEAREALRVICDVFFVPLAPMARWTINNPAFQVYFARWSGRPAAALATLRKDGVVGVYHVATVAAARHRGIAGNLLVLALREAREAGCGLATLTATPEAQHLYEQLGFRTCGMIEQWFPSLGLMATLARGERPSTAYPAIWE